MLTALTDIYYERPEPPQYVAVSAVGFDTDKIKAIVYVRLRDQGEVKGLELQNGRWVTAPKASGCIWIV